MKLKIKPVEGIDIGHIRKMSVDFKKEMGQEYPVVDDEELDKLMLHILTNISNPEYVFLIAYDGKKPAGFFLGYIGVHTYGKPRRVGVAQELYVVPSKRNKLVGYRLIQKAVETALEKGVEGFECVGSYNGTDKRWERYGFKLHLTYGHMSLDEMITLTRKKRYEDLQAISD